MSEREPHVLPDLVRPGLKVVFCGTAAGTKSAQVGQYYAGPGNKFWNILYKTSLTDRQLRPDQFSNLPRFGIGLTDVAKTTFGRDSNLSDASFDVVGLRRKILTSRPRFLAFNGMKAARVFLGAGAVASYGKHVEQIGDTNIFVLPSTSGAANGRWSEAPWFELADLLTP